MMSDEIECLEEVLAYSDPANPWVQLWFDRVRFPDGRVGRYNRIVEGGRSSGVAVLPIWQTQIGLIRQYRYAVKRALWEVPRGYAEANHPEQDAFRELREETGLVTANLHDLGIFFANSAVLTTTVYLYAAKIDDRTAGARLPMDGEASDFRWFPVESILSPDTQIQDGFTLSIILRAMILGVLPIAGALTTKTTHGAL